MLATVAGCSLLGVEGRPVQVEVHVDRGLPSLTMVGLPDASCREARDRVRAAIASSELPWPKQRVTVNLAPSSFPKIGTALDLALAVGILVATDEVPVAAAKTWSFVGELGLDGSLRPVRGMVPLVAGLRGKHRGVVVPTDSYAEASLVPGIAVRHAATLAEAVAALRGDRSWADPPPPPCADVLPPPDLREVRGQAVARTVLEIAAAGGHHLLMCGPPGAGKTLLATRLPGLLPDLDDDQALTATAIHSAAGEPVDGQLLRRPPIRSPHHGASVVSLSGGGSGHMRPGEVSLAHHGVLFLDELGEFPPSALDALRQPIEEGVIRVSRAKGTVTYPARFQLVAATNPCPCGPRSAGCRCSEAGRARYERRLSGPLLDRFDLRLDVGRPDPADLLRPAEGEPTEQVAARVARARALAQSRGVPANVHLDGPALRQAAPLTAEAARLLERMVASGRLTARGLTRTRRVARTIADLDEREGPIGVDDVAAALAVRVPLSGVDQAAAS